MQIIVFDGVVTEMVFLQVSLIEYKEMRISPTKDTLMFKSDIINIV